MRRTPTGPSASICTGAGSRPPSRSSPPAGHLGPQKAHAADGRPPSTRIGYRQRNTAERCINKNKGARFANVRADSYSQVDVGAARSVGDGGRRGTSPPDEVGSPAAHPPKEPWHASAEPRHLRRPGTGGDVARQRRRCHQPPRQPEPPQYAHEPFGLDDAFWVELLGDRKSTRLNSSHVAISYAVFCLKKKNKQ